MCTRETVASPSTGGCGGDAAGESERIRFADIGDDHHELVTAEPTDRVGGAHCRPQCVGHTAQEFVAGVMAAAAGVKVTSRFNMILNAGKATPQPPVGSALGQRGLNLMNFCKAFNDET